MQAWEQSHIFGTFSAVIHRKSWSVNGHETDYEILLVDETKKNTWILAKSINNSASVVCFINCSSISWSTLSNETSLVISRRQHRHVRSKLYASDWAASILFIESLEKLKSNYSRLTCPNNSLFSTLVKISSCFCCGSLETKMLFWQISRICHIGISICDDSANNSNVSMCFESTIFRVGMCPECAYSSSVCYVLCFWKGATIGRVSWIKRFWFRV